MEKDETSLELKSKGMVSLVADPEEIATKFKQYIQLKEKILSENDYYEIKTKNGMQKAIGKSGWYKFAVAFGLSIYVLSENKETIDKEKGLYAYHTMVAVRAPNGREVQDVGTCDNTDLDRHGENEHVIRAMANTRATERAIIKMTGAPEKAAEDILAAKNIEEANNPKNAEVCHCDWSKMKNDKGRCGNCGKPLTIAQIQRLEKH